MPGDVVVVVAVLGETSVAEVLSTESRKYIFLFILVIKLILHAHWNVMQYITHNSEKTT